MTSIISIFNDHFMEFIEDIHSIFPYNTDILTAKNSFIAIKKMNPAIIVKIWVKYIANVYQEQINNDDISFFISKDYSSDLVNSSNSDKIMESINRLRDPVSKMNADEQTKTMKYIKNLTKISLMYNNA
jgi:hypothetical protein